MAEEKLTEQIENYKNNLGDANMKQNAQLAHSYQ
jgi:hypothetical protein